MKKIPITDYMAKNLITLKPDHDIKDAIKIILDHKISGAPVLNSQNELVGILSEKDCLKVIMGGPYYRNPDQKGKVEDFMSRNVKTMPVDGTVQEAALEFINNYYRRMPVMDGKRLVGQVSRRDILRAIKEQEPTINMIPSSWVGNEPMD